MRWLVLTLLIVPILEIIVFVWIGGEFGAWWVIGLIVLTGLIGIALAKQQGIETWKRAQQSLQIGKYPTEQIVDGICILVGALLLITPGFITDVLGFMFVLPWPRQWLKTYIHRLIRHMLSRGTFIYRRW
ncbi:MAG TPA: FxsA family protein [Virgibacillus sp.]|nr:FxsA family protein [Virgibacillus sp.]